MKRYFYIADVIRYHVLTDNINAFGDWLRAYSSKLVTSGKTNNYSFGSVELTDSQFKQSYKETQQYIIENKLDQAEVVQQLANERDPGAMMLNSGKDFKKENKPATLTLVKNEVEGEATVIDFTAARKSRIKTEDNEPPEGA